MTSPSSIFLIPLAILALLLTSANVPAQAPAPPAAGELARLQAGFKSAADAVAAEREKWLAALDTWYLAGLDKQQEPSLKAGDLDTVVAIKNERNALPAHVPATAEHLQRMPAGLRALRMAYDTSLAKITDEVAKRMAPVNQKYLIDLEAAQKRLTIAGDIDQALLVRSERERVASQLPPSALVAARSTSPTPYRSPLTKPAATEGDELIGATVPKHTKFPIVLKGDQRIDTEGTFRPPVEITVVAKLDSKNLRLAYAADTLIFNWEMNQNELRVDGGPASGKHLAGAGKIPTGRYVTVRWRVTPKKQSIFVDDKLRYEHVGDYSKINRTVSVFAAGTDVTVRSLKVLQLPEGTE